MCWVENQIRQCQYRVDVGRHNVASDRMMGPGPYEWDENVSNDAMDTDNHVVNPNEFED